MHDLATPYCAHCGATPDQHRPALIPVVDETGSAPYCAMCLLGVIARFERTGDVSVVVSRPGVSR